MLALLCAASGLRVATLQEYRSKLGMYVWGSLPAGLEAAVADAKALGATGAARVAIGPSWDPSGKKDDSPLDVKIRRPDYRAFLAAFPVVMLTAYDSASSEKYKWGRLDAKQLAATTAEFRRFTLELAKTPGRKIVSNWEFENDCPADKWLACQEYYQARLDGVEAGRREAKARKLPGQVFTAFEFTIVPGFAGRPSGLVDVATKLKGLDFISYSCWWSIGFDADAAKVYRDFAYVVPLLLNFDKEHQLPARLIIGEFGEYWDQHPTAERMKALVDASIEAGAEYLFNWVLYDQPGNKDEWGRDASHFGKYDRDRALTPQGHLIRNWFGAPPPTPARPRGDNRKGVAAVEAGR